MSSGPDLQTQTRASRPVRKKGSGGAVLRVIHPPELEWSLTLGRADVTLGRVVNSPSIPALTHETVSRRHLELTFDGRRRRHVARDLKSHNGTRIDGDDLKDAPIELGDQAFIQIGDVSLVYERIDGDPPLQAGAEAAAIPGQAPAIAKVRKAVDRVASDPSPVLLLGETGTGKEWIAQELHRASGRPGPIVAINCAALSPQIIDSQLFGHVKGAFTGASADHPGMFRAADGGTLFLDEVGELPLELQPKLLRALQEREVQPVGSTKLIPVDVRVVSATNRNLREATERGEFRRDLYARLTLWEIPIPPLRERRGDVLMWIARLHERWLADRPTVPPNALLFTPEAVEHLVLYPWPSNLREVDRVVHALGSLTATGTPIGPELLPELVRRSGVSSSGSTSRPATPAKPPVPNREEFVAVFERLGGNVRAIAKHFDRDRRQIYRWIESHGLSERRTPGKGS